MKLAKSSFMSRQRIPHADRSFLSLRAPLLGVLVALCCAAPALAQGTQKRAAKPAESARPAESAEPAAPLLTPRGPTRIDFDDRLVQGQTNKLGAVYLYQRKTPAQPSLLARRQSFRAEIARDLLE